MEESSNMMRLSGGEILQRSRSYAGCRDIEENGAAEEKNKKEEEKEKKKGEEEEKEK
jgi:hypothetical protein